VTLLGPSMRWVKRRGVWGAGARWVPGADDPVGLVDEDNGGLDLVLRLGDESDQDGGFGTSFGVDEFFHVKMSVLLL